MRILRVNGKNIMLYNDSMIETVNDFANLMIKSQSNCNANLIALDLKNLSPIFFDKTSGMVEYFSQKLNINGIKMAIFGDFSNYNQSETLKFLKEKKCDNLIFLVSSKQEAIKLLQEK